MKISEEICQMLQEAVRYQEDIKKFLDSLKPGDKLKCISKCGKFKKGDIVTFKRVSSGNVIIIEMGSPHARYETKVSASSFEKA